MRGIAIVLGVGVLAAIGAGAYLWTGDVSGDQIGLMPKDVDIVAGQDLYAKTCAACHGVKLEGQEDWRTPGPDGRLPAPPHDESGHTWHHPDQVLFAYTKQGGQEVMAAQGMEFDSGMPGFGGQLTDQEIWNILGFIKSTWSDRAQESQAARSEDEARIREN